jgi:RNA polymerase sigma-70 factor (ECF subfamily)
MNIRDERYLLDKLKQGNKEAFSLLFNAFYKDLVLFGGNFLPDKNTCEDIVQSLFLKLWNERATLVIETSLKSYLLKAVRNGCLDEIRHRNVILEHESYSLSTQIPDMDTENYIFYTDLQKHIQQALNKIPGQYREAFELNRFEGLKYKEIAEKLQVSERTIEVRISKAIELLRKSMKDFFHFIIYIF